ncbi:HEAT repeat domain-containing protein [Streptomyces koyangensis]|uniref:NACHT domain-containing protein n=1 Tax=Streptomyces koyangensis TaxID=188770 RepID=A0A385DBV6_9ACTN|nr:HEAT repeat domain-containing protein [Streptomyces koyangensis]AXQ55539.1 NACHT domain-containing protein [Streptomyces koyangensis]
MAAESGGRKRGPKAELLRRRLNDLRVEAEAARGREGTQARLEREVRRTGEPGTETFRGQRVSDWAPARADTCKLPQDLGPLLAVVAVWSAWAGEASLRSDGTIAPAWRKAYKGQWDRLLREAHEEREEPVASARADAAEKRAHIGLYLERVRKRHRRLNLDVLGPSGMAGEQAMIEVRQVFMPQLAKPYVPRMREELRLALQTRGELVDALEAGAAARLPERGEPPRPVLAALAEESGRRVVVLGDPGAGKSTLAKYLALALAGGLEAVPEELARLEGLVPVLVELREYAVPEAWSDTLEDFIERAHVQAYLPLPRELLTGLLREGGAVVLFDGLDEVFDPATRAAMARRVTAFAAKYPKCRVVVTSREYGYQSHEFVSADFCQLMLEDLTREQVEEFVRRWYRAAYPDDPQLAERRIDRMLGAVRDVGSVGELAGNPLLLTILAAIGQSRTIPRERREMYAHAIEVLIERWDRDAKLLAPPTPCTTDVAHALEGLTVSRRLKLLERVARRMQEGVGSPAGTFIHHDDLIDIVRDFLVESNVGASVAMAAAKELVDHLRTRNFLLAHYGGGLYGFVHRTFMEYLAALDLLRRRDEEEWEREELVALLAERAQEPAWHEVLLLMAGKLRQKDVAAFLGRLLELYWASEAVRGPMLPLAVRVLAEVEEVGPPREDRQRAVLSVEAQSDAIVDALIFHTVSRSPFDIPRPALRTFDHFWSGRERYLRWYRGRVAAGAGPWPAASVVASLTRDIDEALTLLDDPWDDRVGGELLPELSRWSAKEKGLDYVVRVAAGEGMAHRPDAFSLLGSLWPHEERAYAAVLAGVSACHLETCVAAIESLRYWADRPDCLDTLLTAGDSDVPHIRGAALVVLAESPGDRALAALEAGLTDEDPEVRRLALIRQASGFLLHGEEARKLVLLATADNDAEVRDYAYSTIAVFWPEHEETRKTALSALGESEPERRASALWAFGDMFPTGTGGAAVRRSLTDPDAGVREAAVAAIGMWPDHVDDVADALVKAAGDPEPAVRVRAVRALSDCDGALDLLLAASTDEDDEVREAAVTLLGRHSADEEAFDGLLRALEDESPDVRIRAIASLPDAVTRPESARPALHAPLSDPDPTVRSAALEALTLRWPTHPETHTATLNFATTDPDPTVRADAITALAVRHPDQAHPLALRAATEDNSPETRSRYLRLVTLLWPDAPTTPTLLTDRAHHDESDQVRTTATEGLARLRWLATEIA